MPSGVVMTTSYPTSKISYYSIHRLNEVCKKVFDSGGKVISGGRDCYVHFNQKDF